MKFLESVRTGQHEASFTKAQMLVLISSVRLSFDAHSNTEWL